MTTVGVASTLTTDVLYKCIFAVAKHVQYARYVQCETEQMLHKDSLYVAVYVQKVGEAHSYKATVYVQKVGEAHSYRMPLFLVERTFRWIVVSALSWIRQVMD